MHLHDKICSYLYFENGSNSILMYSIFYILANIRGLDAYADTLFTANRAIVEAIVQWVHTATLPEAARLYIIDTLVHLEPFINFYQYSTNEGRVVQLHVEFEITGASGDRYYLRFVIDVDSLFESTLAHMGYEIHFGTNKVQVGHLYLRNGVPIGRPPLATFDRSTTVSNGPQGEERPIQDKKGIRNGKGKWKSTIWKVKKNP